MKFEFDPAKSAANRDKHGIDFVEAQRLWDNRRLELSSPQSATEARRLVIGMIGDRIWTAVVTERGNGVRLISCRRARRNEEHLYEQAR